LQEVARAALNIYKYVILPALLNRCLLTLFTACLPAFLLLVTCSACSRETDNQDTPGVAMDASWQSKLLRSTLQQHEMACNSPSAAAARSLAGLQASGFDPSQLQWGMGRCYGSSSAAGMSLPAAGLPGLQGLSAAQALALLCTPLYAAAAERQYQHQAAIEAAAAVAAGGMGAAAQRSGGGVAVSSGDRGAGGRSKSRRTAPSVNSGSTGPPLGAKRALEAEDEERLPAKKVCLLSFLQAFISVRALAG
jgi:hypothetical protein